MTKLTTFYFSHFSVELHGGKFVASVLPIEEGQGRLHSKEKEPIGSEVWVCTICWGGKP